MVPTMNSHKTAFITGFTGQDGTFLTELLLKKGYKVVGLCRRVSSEPPIRTRGRFDFSEALASGRLVLEAGDLLSVNSLINIIKTHHPDEVYNLAAQSDVHVSFAQPELSIETGLMGVVNLITALEASQGLYNITNRTWKMYQASTSEMFGDQKSAMDEDTPFLPNSPYAIAKAAAHYYCNYKRQQGHFIACGILFNHESEIRGGNFVTQKIARGVAAWRLHEIDVLELGNLDSVRDWGYAGDYVRAMWLMLQQPTPDDFVVGTGQTHTIRQFIEAAFKALPHSQKVVWRGDGKNTRGYVDDQLFAVVSDKYWRPVDVRYLHGNATKALHVLGWTPEVSFGQLVDIMVKAAHERTT